MFISSEGVKLLESVKVYEDLLEVREEHVRLLASNLLTRDLLHTSNLLPKDLLPLRLPPGTIADWHLGARGGPRAGTLLSRPPPAR